VGGFVPAAHRKDPKRSRPPRCPDEEAIEAFVADLPACPLRARRQSQEQYLTGTHGQPQMLPDLLRGGQRCVTVQFPS
jgi:hypothetical protein